jgi:proteasome lid subunit RPN8/RPN11
MIEFGEPVEFELPLAELPSEPNRKNNFRVYVLESAHKKMLHHVRQRLDVESGGILIGYPFRTPDSSTTFVVIIDIVVNKSNDRSSVHFTVSPEETLESRLLIEKKFPGLMSVGWYHSHPGLHVFLSSQDMTIVRSIYNASWNVAWVIDPINNTEGIFYGPEGESIVVDKKEISLKTRAWHVLYEIPECIKSFYHEKENMQEKLGSDKKINKALVIRPNNMHVQTPTENRLEGEIGSDLIPTAIGLFLFLSILGGIALTYLTGNFQTLDIQIAEIVSLLVIPFCAYILLSNNTDLRHGSKSKKYIAVLGLVTVALLWSFLAVINSNSNRLATQVSTNFSDPVESAGLTATLTEISAPDLNSSIPANTVVFQDIISTTSTPLVVP